MIYESPTVQLNMLTAYTSDFVYSGEALSKISLYFLDELITEEWNNNVQQVLQTKLLVFWMWSFFLILDQLFY